jgi:methionyl-tRNA synthetase
MAEYTYIAGISPRNYIPLAFCKPTFILATMLAIKETISYEDFSKIDVRVGKIINCEKVEKSEKLLKLEVDFGELGKRQILTGLAQFYTCDQMVGLKTLFIVNLPSRKMMGLDSDGMILGIGMDHTQKPTLVQLSEDAVLGNGLS